MLLRPAFPNGVFGDPALYVAELNDHHSILVDCGDLSRLTTRQLLKVSHIFVSHCHIDHFFGFDHFLRVHIGSEKTVHVVGPPGIDERLAGKLQGYTWNLVADQALEFIAVALDAEAHELGFTRFHARDAFRASERWTRPWTKAEPVHDAGTYHVSAEVLDHRTPSVAFAIEEKLKVQVNADRLGELGLRPGGWINRLKRLFLFGGLDTAGIEAELESGGGTRSFRADELAREVFIPRQRHKIAYSTDGAASAANRERLLALVAGADLWYSETCFLEADRAQADETRHFTARFIAEIARDAGVKRLAPFHFSKRYLQSPEAVLAEVRSVYTGELLDLRDSG